MVSFATAIITLQILILRVFSCWVCSEMPMMQQAWIFYRLFLLKLDIWNMPALSIPMNYWTTIIPGHLDIKINKLMCSTQIQQESLTSAQWWPCGFLQGGVNRSLSLWQQRVQLHQQWMKAMFILSILYPGLSKISQLLLVLICKVSVFVWFW